MRWRIGWGDSVLAAGRIRASSVGNTVHWYGASSWVALACAVLPFVIIGIALYLRSRRK